MSCMYFSLNQRLQDDSTESSESITYWRKPLVVFLLGVARMLQLRRLARRYAHPQRRG
jgi:hypothetical protein